MGNDIATTEPQSLTDLPRPEQPMKAGGMLAAFVPQSAAEALSLAKAIAASGMAPKSFGTDPNKVLVGMMAGAEVGLTPFAALQSIAVINGNPSLWGDGALALVQASGLLEDMDETDDGHTATCTMTRKGRATPIVRTFDMDDAKKAGLAGKTGPWQQYPKRMRQMRARSLAMRDGFADVLKGLRIAEEVRDYSGTADIDLTANETTALTAEMLTDQSQPLVEPEVEQAEEVPHDPETGEIEEATDAPDAAEAIVIIGEIEGAKDTKAVDAVAKKYEATVAQLPDDLAKQVKDAANKRRKALEPANEGDLLDQATA